MLHLTILALFSLRTYKSFEISLTLSALIMKIKVGDKEDGNSTDLPASSSSNSAFYTDQALHDGLLGYSQIVNWRSDIGRRYSFDTRELMVVREMEKRRVRRELEEEVIREMVMGREVFNQRVPLFNRRDGFGFRTGIGEGLSRPDCGVLGGLPFDLQPRSKNAVAVKPIIDFSKKQKFLGDESKRSANAVAVKPIIDLSKGQQLLGDESKRLKNAVAVKPIIDLSKRHVVPSVKPVYSISAGVKRNFEEPIPDGADGTRSVTMSKKLRKELKCSLCQVTVPCERTLKNHLKGKKHKAKEMALQRTCKTARCNAENSDTEKSNDLGKCLNENVDDTNDLKDADHGVTNSSAEANEKQTKTELNTDFKFWCTMCRFGTISEALMTSHRSGKKHVTLLREYGGCVIAIKTTPDKVNKTEDTTAGGKEESLGNVVGGADTLGADRKEDAAVEVE
ncbi:uncharacterized protein LOC130765178 isoform X2 [Actinidia eriantha]|uniref:uncharacterized protein LOC130765178 isoform X2 n=1 Tax=Actinidia eriantha TaxID=165200 RepID=UPI002582EC6A|nr:uncharacterized protein LOC130765178 isoform X2 [Actinidia eriantha]